MIAAVIQGLSLIAGAAVAGMVVMTAVMGWGGNVGRWRRIGLCLTGAGLVWAGPSRLLGYPSGIGDLLFLIGLGVHLTALYGRAWWGRLDALDGAVDGHVSLPRRRPYT
jgi:hypothetical protein